MTSAQTKDAQPSGLPRGWALGCGIIILLCLLLLAVGGGYGYYLWSQKPAGWKRAQHALAAIPVARQKEMAANFEKRLTASLSFTDEFVRAYRQGTASGNTGSPGSVSHTVTLGADEINAWLQQRLPMWLANRDADQHFKVPQALSDFRYWIDDGKPVLACRIRHDNVDQIVSARFDVRILPDGKAKLKLLRVQAGSATIPANTLTGWIVSQVTRQSPAGDKSPTVQRLTAILLGLPFDPVYPVTDHDQARLTDFHLDHGKLILTFKTEAKRAKPSSAKGG